MVEDREALADDGVGFQEGAGEARPEPALGLGQGDPVEEGPDPDLAEAGTRIPARWAVSIATRFQAVGPTRLSSRFQPQPPLSDWRRTTNPTARSAGPRRWQSRVRR